MHDRSFRIIACVAMQAALCGALASGCNASSNASKAHAREHAAGATAPTLTPALRVEEVPRPRIPDIVLTDQYGKQHRFYTDLIAGKLVIMNSIFTSCGGSCPVQTHIFSGVQRQLGDRVGKEVQMISITLDPAIDTPERLREFADRHGAGPGWLFLTGPRPEVAKVLQAMDIYAADPTQHAPIAVLGNEPAGVWMKTINLASPVEIVKKLDHVASLDLKQVVERYEGEATGAPARR